MKQTSETTALFNEINHDLKGIISCEIKVLKSVMQSSSKTIKKADYDMLNLTCNSCLNTLRILEAFDIYEFKKQNLKLDLQYQKFDAIKLLKDVIKEHRTVFKYCDVKIKLDLSNKIAVKADKQLIERAFERVINYWANHAYNKSAMDIICHKIGHEIMFKVKFSSDYILKETLENIFALNFTNDVTLKTCYALELFAIKEIAAAHYGRIIAQSTGDDVMQLGFYMPLF